MLRVPSKPDPGQILRNSPLFVLIQGPGITDYLSTHLSVNLSIHPLIYLTFLHLSTCLNIFFSHSRIDLDISIYLLICFDLSIYIYLSIYLYLSTHFSRLELDEPCCFSYSCNLFYNFSRLPDACRLIDR